MCNGYVRKRWNVTSVLAVKSHKEWIWLVHFQCCRLWKSILLIVCRNESIFVRWVVLSSPLLNSNFKLLPFGLKRKTDKIISVVFKGRLLSNFIRKSHTDEWNKRIQVVKMRQQSQSEGIALLEDISWSSVLQAIGHVMPSVHYLQLFAHWSDQIF